MTTQSITSKTSRETKVNYARAQIILGSDFITPEEVMRYRTVVYTNEQISALVESLSSFVVLDWCRNNGYALIPYPPTKLSLLDVRELKPENFFLKSGGWYANHKNMFFPFSLKVMPSSGWLMIRKVPVPNSTLCNWGEQLPLLSALERVPSSAEMAWFITTYFEVRGVRLFRNTCVRTSSFDSQNGRVHIGYFNAEGLYITGISYDYRYSDTGLASARK